FAFAEIKDIIQRTVVIERSHRALNDIIDICVIAPRGAISKSINGLAGVNATGELMNRQIWTLPWAINREISQRDDAHLVKMRVGRAKKFACDFCRAVRAERLDETLVLGKWHRLRSSVHRRAGRENESLNAGYARRLEKVQCANDVRVVIKPRVLNGRPNASACSQMHNCVSFFAVKHSPHRVALAKIDVANGYVF